MSKTTADTIQAIGMHNGCKLYRKTRADGVVSYRARGDGIIAEQFTIPEVKQAVDDLRALS